ncbi:MAG: pirin family protein [bacterium]
MIHVRRSNERGHFDFGWLNTYHTFSFGDYYDPTHMGFRDLRVINEDTVQPANGFGTHPHRDMEIITYVMEGTLKHQDSMGNGSLIRPGEVQRMSAGVGVTHSEFNPSEEHPVHFYQIWILPEKKGIAPGYEQKIFSSEEKRGKLRLVASRDGREGSLSLHQDVDLYASLLKAGDSVKLKLKPGRHAWLQVARGKVDLNGDSLQTSDGASASEEEELVVRAVSDSEILLFNLN